MIKLTQIAAAKYDIIKKGGSLTLTSGTGAMKPGKTASIGGALNAGLFTMTTGLANELTDKKIRVNCVVPGMVATELWDKMGKSKEDQEKQFADAAKSLPVGFCATGEDIAEAYLYAVRADYTNGTLIVIGESTLQDSEDLVANVLKTVVEYSDQLEVSLFPCCSMRAHLVLTSKE